MPDFNTASLIFSEECVFKSYSFFTKLPQIFLKMYSMDNKFEITGT